MLQEWWSARQSTGWSCPGPHLKGAGVQGFAAGRGAGVCSREGCRGLQQGGVQGFAAGRGELPG